MTLDNTAKPIAAWCHHFRRSRRSFRAPIRMFQTAIFLPSPSRMIAMPWLLSLVLLAGAVQDELPAVTVSRLWAQYADRMIRQDVDGLTDLFTADRSEERRVGEGWVSGGVSSRERKYARHWL